MKSPSDRKKGKFPISLTTMSTFLISGGGPGVHMDPCWKFRGGPLGGPGGAFSSQTGVLLFWGPQELLKKTGFYSKIDIWGSSGNSMEERMRCRWQCWKVGEGKGGRGTPLGAPGGGHGSPWGAKGEPRKSRRTLGYASLGSRGSLGVRGSS